MFSVQLCPVELRRHIWVQRIAGYADMIPIAVLVHVVRRHIELHGFPGGRGVCVDAANSLRPGGARPALGGAALLPRIHDAGGNFGAVLRDLTGYLHLALHGLHLPGLLGIALRLHDARPEHLLRQRVLQPSFLLLRPLCP